MTVAALEVAALCGVGPRLSSEIDVAAEHLEELVVAWGPDGDERSEPKALARALHGTVPVIAGAGLTTPIAYRWKCQINENAKTPAFCGRAARARPQRDRGLGGGGGARRFSAVFLDDSDTHPRVKERLELTRRLIEPTSAGTHVVASRGETTVERVFSLVLLGDLVSLYLAVLRGVDPGPVEAIQRLKTELAREG